MTEYNEFESQSLDIHSGNLKANYKAQGMSINFIYVTIILLFNALLVFLSLVFHPQYTTSAMFVSMLFDIVLAALLIFKPEKPIIYFAILRAVMGLVIFGFKAYLASNYLLMVLQIVYSLGIILLLLYNWQKLKHYIAGLVFVIQLTLLGLNFGSIYTANNLDDLYSLEDQAVSIVKGLFFEYEINIDNDNWYLRDRDAVLQENPVVDQWIVNSKKDLHIMVIAEEYTPNQKFGLGDLREAVIRNAKNASKRFLILEEFGTTNEFHKGTILHAKANFNALDVEYLYGLYVVGNNAFQVVCFGNPNKFSGNRNLFINMINSFTYSGEIIVIDKTI